MDEFWRNLQTAAGFITLPPPPDDAPERQLRETRFWLTPRTVTGYREEDFTFLEPAQRTALHQAVARFRAVADQVPFNHTPTQEQVEAGKAALRDILDILPLNRFPDAESYHVQTLLQRMLAGQLPRWVTGVTCRTGTDHVGDPGIWITVDVTDDATDKGKVVKQGQAIHDIVMAAYERIGGRLWPFIRFRSPDLSIRR